MVGKWSWLGGNEPRLQEQAQALGALGIPMDAVAATGARHEIRVNCEAPGLARTSLKLGFREHKLRYESLVAGLGGVTVYFGHPEWGVRVSGFRASARNGTMWWFRVRGPSKPGSESTGPRQTSAAPRLEQPEQAHRREQTPKPHGVSKAKAGARQQPDSDHAAQEPALAVKVRGKESLHRFPLLEGFRRPSSVNPNWGRSLMIAAPIRSRTSR